MKNVAASGEEGEGSTQANITRSLEFQVSSFEFRVQSSEFRVQSSGRSPTPDLGPLTSELETMNSKLETYWLLAMENDGVRIRAHSNRRGPYNALS